MRLPVRSWNNTLKKLGLRWATKDEVKQRKQRESQRLSFETLEPKQLLALSYEIAPVVDWGQATEGSEGIVASWRMTEESADAVDWSGHGYHMEDMGTAGSATASINGIQGGAREFEGNDASNTDHFKITPTVPVGDDNPFSIATHGNTVFGWFKWEDLGTNGTGTSERDENFKVLAAKSESSSAYLAGDEWSLVALDGSISTSGDPTIAFMNHDPVGGYQQVVSDDTVDFTTDDEWHFVAAGYDSVSDKTWVSIDGQAKVFSSTTTNSPAETSLPFTVGAHSGTTGQFYDKNTYTAWSGQLDEWGVYKGMLSDDQIDYLHNMQTVNSTDDDNTSNTAAGEVTLRSAIEDANAATGIETEIRFDIELDDAGYDTVTKKITIDPASALPDISDTVLVNGFTQPDYAHYGLIDGHDDTEPNLFYNSLTGEVVLDAADLPSNVIGGYVLNSTGGDFVSGNHDPIWDAGAAQSSSTQIGDLTVLDTRAGFHNIGAILASDLDAAGLAAAMTSTSANGPIGQGTYDFELFVTPVVPASDVQLIEIDGTSAGTGTDGLTLDDDEIGVRGLVIHSFDGAGILIDSGDGSEVQGNLIGTDLAGSSTVGNDEAGIHIDGGSDALIGGELASEENTISHNTGDGVYVQSGTDNVILSNTFNGNGGLRIDIGADGVNTNDSLDADTGANDLQNRPTLTSAEVYETSTKVVGSLDSAASTSYRVDFFVTDGATAAASTTGPRWVGSKDVTTDGSGDVDFTVYLGETLAAGEYVVATAAELISGERQSTSEFAAAALITQSFASETVTSEFDLKASWRLTEGAGDAVDSTGNGYDLTEMGGTSSYAGVQGGAREFEGNDASNNDYFKIDPTIPAGEDNPFSIGTHGNTIFGWFKWEDLGTNGTGSDERNEDIKVIAAKSTTYDASGDDDEWVLGAVAETYPGANNPAIMFAMHWEGFGVNSHVIKDTSTSFLTDGAWHFVAAGYDPVLDKSWMSVDGGTKTYSNSTLNQPLEGDTPFTLGAHSKTTGTYTEKNTYTAFSGQLDEWGLHEGVMSDDQLDYMYNMQTVNSTDDDNTSNTAAGEVTLRSAIEDANSSSGATEIRFDIELDDAGYDTVTKTVTIDPGSALPDITDGVVIDGFSQPDYAHYDLTSGDNAAQPNLFYNATTGEVTLDPTGLVDDELGFYSLTSTGDDLIGANHDPVWFGFLSTNTYVSDFTSSSEVTGFQNIGNVLATDLDQSGLEAAITTATGRGALGTTAVDWELFVEPTHLDAPSVQIVQIDGSSAGTGVDGLTFADDDIAVRGLAILDFDGDGFEIDGGNENVIQGNLIGTDLAGSTTVGMGGAGVHIAEGSGNMVGSSDSAGMNAINNNTGDAVDIADGANNAVLGNVYLDNTGLPIDLNSDGATANDTEDADNGVHDLQNKPVLTKVESQWGKTWVEGTFESNPATTYRIDLFVTDVDDVTDSETGAVWFGSFDVTTDGDGLVTIDAMVETEVTRGHYVVATARVNNGDGTYGGSSELSGEELVRFPNSIIIDNGDAEFATFGEDIYGADWATQSGSGTDVYGTDYLTALYNTNNNGIPTDGSSSAVWTFDDLDDGTYDIYLSYTSAANYAKIAPYSVYAAEPDVDGEFDIDYRMGQDIMIDQSTAVEADVSDSERDWEKLSRVVVDDGVVSVRLGTGGNLGVTEYVVADAMMLQQVNEVQGLIGDKKLFVNSMYTQQKVIDLGEAFTGAGGLDIPNTTFTLTGDSEPSVLQVKDINDETKKLTLEPTLEATGEGATSETELTIRAEDTSGTIVETSFRVSAVRNLLDNGSFEETPVTANGWYNFESEAIPGWTIETDNEGLFEVQRSAVDYNTGYTSTTPPVGGAYNLNITELDANAGNWNGLITDVSLAIWQEFETDPGQHYSVSFWFSGRSDTQENDNILQVTASNVTGEGDSQTVTALPGTLLDGSGEAQVFNEASTITDPDTGDPVPYDANGNSNTTDEIPGVAYSLPSGGWKSYTYNFVATGETTRIKFDDLGESDKRGTLLDAIVAYPSVGPDTEGCGPCEAAAGSSSGNDGGDSLASYVSDAGVRSDGMVSETINQLGSDGYGLPFGQSVTLTNHQIQSSGDVGRGNAVSQMPRLKMDEMGTTVYATSGSTTRKYDGTDAGGRDARHHRQDKLTHSSGYYTESTTNGDVIKYHDFTHANEAQRGAIASHADKAGNLTSYTYDANGKLEKVERSTTFNSVTTTEKYEYAYVSAGPNEGMLESVTLKRKVDAGSFEKIRSTVNSYYQDGDANGNTGDLSHVKLRDENDVVIDVTYIRYYDYGDAKGFGHGVKHIFRTDSYERMADALNELALPVTPEAATDAQVEAYADTYYEYDSRHRVTATKTQGTGCDACDGGLGLFEYEYEFSTNEDGFNSWKYKTTETLPDGNQNIVFTNFVGQVMLHVFVEDPAGPGETKWHTFTKYDEEGRVVMEANPSAVSGYSEAEPDLLDLDTVTGRYAFLRDTEGLITTKEYYASTAGTATTINGFAVVASDPYDTAEYVGPVDRVTLTFNADVQPGTFTTADIVSFTRGATDISGSITAVNEVSPNEFEVVFAAQSIEETYTLVIDENIRDINANLMNQDGDGTAGEDGQDEFTLEFDLVDEGGVSGYLKSVSVQQGETNSAHKLSERDYVAATAGGVTVYHVANSTVYQSENNADGQTTEFDYVFRSGTTQIEKVTTTLPRISAAKNGHGSEDAVIESVLDEFGRMIWSKDADGYIGYMEYDQGTGSVIKMIADVDDTGSGFVGSLPAGWTTPSDGGLHLTTTMEVDQLGRTTKVTDPNLNVTYTVYNDDAYEVRTYAGWDTGSSKSTLPIQIWRQDRDGSYTEVVTLSTAVTPTLNGGVPTGQETFTTAQIENLSRAYTNAGGQLSHRDVYFSLDSVTYSTDPDLGTQGTHYLRTEYGYDSRGRRNRVVDPTGTINRTVYDSLGRVASTWVGTNDSPAMHEWAPDNNDGSSNMLQTGAYEYDGGSDGDSNLTSSDAIFGDGTGDKYTTEYFYDFRNRRTITRGPDSVATLVEYNNLGQVTASKVYADADNDIETVVEAGELRGQSATSYDEQSRSYETIVYEVNQSTGVVGTSLTNETYYNHRGLVAKQESPNGLYHKTAYDGAGRPIVSYVSFDSTGDADWDAALTVTGDTVIEQTETIYDAGGRVVTTLGFKRYEDGTGTGELTADASYRDAVVNWYDKANRVTNTAFFGRDDHASNHYVWDANDDLIDSTGVIGIPDVAEGTAKAPNGNDDWIATKTEFDTAGRAYRGTDNLGRIRQTTFDLMNRAVTVISNYVNGAVTASETDTDVTTEYVYDSLGRLNVRRAKNANGTSVVDQNTTYTYEATIDKNWLASTTYPDSADSTDKVSKTYDRLGRVDTTTDQRGVIHDLVYDSAGRLEVDKVTDLGLVGENVDDDVRRIERTFDDMSRVETMSSFAAISGGTPLNQVKYTYNGWGFVGETFQEHSGEVSTTSTASVAYTFEDGDGSGTGPGKYVRLDSVTYPDGRTVEYDYSTAGSIDDILSRVQTIGDGITDYAAYEYVGAGKIVSVSHEDVDGGLNLDYNRSTTHAYEGWDTFGRIVENTWDDDSSTILDSYDYAYDRGSNRTSRSNNLVTTTYDEVYSFDGLNRLTTVTRGGSAYQDWTLDALGNWEEFDDNGTVEDRGFNAANEMTSTDAGTVNPEFDRAGNMIAGPDPSDSDVRQHYKYDAWNRLVGVFDDDGMGDIDETSPIAEFTYDGRNFRIEKSAGGVDLAFYYNESQQLLEEHKGTDEDPLNQYVWDLHYIDSPIVRFHDADTDNSYDDPGDSVLYYMTDGNMNVTGLIDQSDGSVVERYHYDAYGNVIFLEDDWDVAATQESTVDNDYLYTGRRLDTETGLMYYRARYYDASLGRFINRDPIGYGDGMNPYLYVGGNPVLYLDPSGLEKWSFVKQDGADIDGVVTDEEIEDYTQRWLGLLAAKRARLTYIASSTRAMTAHLATVIVTNDAHFRHHSSFARFITLGWYDRTASLVDQGMWECDKNTGVISESALPNNPTNNNKRSDGPLVISAKITSVVVTKISDTHNRLIVKVEANTNVGGSITESVSAAVQGGGELGGDGGKIGGQIQLGTAYSITHDAGEAFGPHKATYQFDCKCEED